MACSPLVSVCILVKMVLTDFNFSMNIAYSAGFEENYPRVSLIPWLSHHHVCDHLKQSKTGRWEGLGTRLTYVKNT